MRRKLAALQHFEERIAERLRKLVFFVVGHRAAHFETIDARHFGDLQRGVFEPVDHAVLVHRHQPRADFDGAGVDDLTALDDGDLAGAAADIDVHDREIAALVIGHVDRAGTVGRQDGFEIMPRRGADKFPRFRGKQRGDRFGVFLFHRFAGDDDRAGVDVFGRQIGFAIGFVNKIAELVGIDRRLVDVGRQEESAIRG